MKYLLYICFFLLIVLIFSYINTITSSQKENFTPNIRGFYRPIIRRTRLAAEGFYNKASSHMNNSSTSIDNFLKRIGLV